MKKRRGQGKRGIKIIATIFSLMVICLAVFSTVKIIAKHNQTLTINEYVVRSERLPSAFDGYKIAQISDLHNAEFGENNENLLSALSTARADVIVITGDLVDSRKTDLDVALRFVEKAVEIAPIYYVTGNHEASISAYVDLKKGLISCGVTVLENQAVTVEKDGASIRFMGLQDPLFRKDLQTEETYVKAQLSTFAWGAEYTVLLSHRPEFFDVYAEYGADLVFCGHTHGGQFRIPTIGGVFVPNQGFFPKYDAGKFEKGQTTMFINRGLGNSRFPFRINNPPEIILTTLKRKQ